MNSENLILFDACGDMDKSVTPELLKSLNLAYSGSDKDFLPLTARELSFMHFGDGFELADGAYCRYPRMYLNEGFKVLNLSDDDHYQLSEGKLRSKQFNHNFCVAKKVYAEIAQAFGVKLILEHDNTTYFVDVYIPIHVFDFLQSKEDFVSYFKQKKYLTCSHARLFKTNQLANTQSSVAN